MSFYDFKDHFLLRLKKTDVLQNYISLYLLYKNNIFN